MPEKPPKSKDKEKILKATKEKDTLKRGYELQLTSHQKQLSRNISNKIITLYYGVHSIYGDKIYENKKKREGRW